MTIQQIKSQLSIERVLNHYGLIANRNGMLSCPFHDDKTPSFQVYPKTNSYCCFSTNCDVESGDQLQLIELLEIKLGRVAGPSKESKYHAIQVAKGLLGYREESLEEIFTRLRHGLKRSKKAQAYAESRGIDVGKEEVGYNGGSYEDLKYCLVFPLRDRSGRMVSFYGRSIMGNAKTRHFYQSGRSGLYPGYPALSTRRLILTEGVLDALSLRRRGELLARDSVLALYGAQVLGDEQEKAIKELKELEEVVLFFDGDSAGAAAVQKWSVYLSKLLGPGIKLSQVATPEGEDISSLLETHENGILQHLLDQRALLTPSRSATPTAQSKLDTSNPSLIVYTHAPVQCTLIGGVSLNNIERLRVTLKVTRHPHHDSSKSLRHSFDLYNDDQLERYARKASDKLDLSSTELRKILSRLVDQVEAYRLASLSMAEVKRHQKRELSEERRRAAIDYLSTPKLLRRTNNDIGRTGVVGEPINRLIMYLCYTSRLRQHPLHVISLGASGTGKTYLQEKIAELIPASDKVEFTASTDNAFYYIDGGDLRHKLVLVEDMDGVESVLYPLRELQTKKRISKITAQKDRQGRIRTIRIEVEGPICLAGTTTRERLYEDNANRSLLLYRDNSDRQREAIMDYQRKVSAGQVNKKEEEGLKEFFKDVQSVLRPIAVRNPYAGSLRIPKSCFKPLRTHAHYLHFIEAVTFYHQYQREIKVDPLTEEPYIETTLDDIEAANALIKDVLLAKSDELSGACRSFLERLKYWLKQSEKSTFYSKEVRNTLRLHPSKLKRYLIELQRYDRIKVVSGSRHRGYEYELVEDQDYAALQSNIKSILSNILEELRKKSGLVVQ